jgi:hypothetical protein
LIEFEPTGIEREVCARRMCGSHDFCTKFWTQADQ